MNTNDFGTGTQLWLDRLACGELDEHTRKSLFTWLDAEPAMASRVLSGLSGVGAPLISERVAGTSRREDPRR